MCELVFSPCLIFQSVQTRGRLTASHTLSLLGARPPLSVSCVMDDRGGKITNSTVDLHCSGWMAGHTTQRGGHGVGNWGNMESDYSYIICYMQYSAY